MSDEPVQPAPSPTGDITAARWAHAPLEETLRGARALSVSIADELRRAEWLQLARANGVSARHWRRHDPLPSGAAIIAVVDGAPALDVAAWARVVALIPGATALPARTAAEFGVARASLAPPGRTPRLLDLLRARRRRRATRRLLAGLDAELARHHARVEGAVADALAPGDDGRPLDQLPAYALAARLEQLVAASAAWSLPPVVDQLAGAATARLVQVLVAAGRAPGVALMEASRLQSTAALAEPAEHLLELADVAMAAGPAHDAALAAWQDSPAGWHAMRDLLVEAVPLREFGERVLQLTPRAIHPVEVPRVDDDLAAEVGELAALARRLDRARVLVQRDRALLHAGLRATCRSLAAALVRSGGIEVVDQAFDLALDDLARLARGAAIEAPGSPHVAASSSVGDGSVVAIGETQLRGIPAGSGEATGRLVVLEDPPPDLDVEGAVVACRSADPAWIPLLLRAGAVVTETGGPTSVAASVARASTLPAVVAVRGLLAAVAGAGSAHVDAAAGTVTTFPDR